MNLWVLFIISLALMGPAENPKNLIVIQVAENQELEKVAAKLAESVASLLNYTVDVSVHDNKKKDTTDQAFSVRVDRLMTGVQMFTLFIDGISTWDEIKRTEVLRHITGYPGVALAEEDRPVYTA